MSMRTKYIVVEINACISVHEVAVCFPEFIGHDDMARKMNVKHEDVISAGFFTTSVDKNREVSVDAFGKSTSLNKSARMQDSALIKKSICASYY